MKNFKRLLLAMVFAIGFSALVSAASPVFLICGTYPVGENAPTAFLVSIDNAAPVTVTPTPYNGALRVHYPVGTLAPGQHTATVAAKNLQGTTAFSQPFTFTVAMPTVPTSLGLTNQ